MKTTALILAFILYGMLMAMNLADCAEPGKRSEPGERLAPGHFMTPDGRMWDGESMKRYFSGARSPFKQPKTKPQFITPKGCAGQRELWMEY